MAHQRKLSLTQFLSKYGTEADCRTYLYQQRWPNGFICPSCSGTRCWQLSDGKCECAECGHQTSVTAGTVMHHSHVPLTKWFLAMFLVSQDKRGISAVELSAMLGTTYKTAWSMLHRLRKAMLQRDNTHLLSGTVEFDNAFIGGPTVGKKRGAGTEKAKVFVALSLKDNGNPLYLKMEAAKDIRQKTVRNFAVRNIQSEAIIHTDGYRSYIKGLSDYKHEPTVYDPDSGLLHWIHITISNAKTFILGTYHGLPQKYLNDYLAEYAFRFSRRNFGGALFDRLALAVAASKLPD